MKRREIFRSRAARTGAAWATLASLTGACSDPPAPEISDGTSATGGAGAAPGGTGSGLSTGAGSGGTSGATTGGVATGGTSTGGTSTGGTSTGGISTGGTSTGGTSASGGSGALGGAGNSGGTAAASGTPGLGGMSGGAGSGAGRGGAGSGGVAGSTGSGGSAGDRGTPEGVCARWNGDRANVSEGTWSGNVASCTVGDISADGRANALRLFNLYRWLADLPAVTTEASRDAQAQACALLQQANRAQGLSHEPPNTWTCWTQQGADGASSSNISSGPGVSSVDGYMIDNGNETTFGHRRIVLSNELGPIGLGSTATGASCMQNLRGTGRAGKTWLAWPAPGIIPLQAIRRSNNSSLDRTGWSIQSNTINLATGTVTVTAAGVNQPVTVSALTGSYGGTRYAVRIVPNGWTTTAGQTYTVSVAGITTPISYDVRVVDCSL